MKTIKSLINTNKKVYVRMRSDEICKAFFEQAEREGFTFGGEKPTAKQPSDLIAVLPDKTICYNPPAVSYSPEPSAILIIGCNERLPCILREMCKYLISGMQICLMFAFGEIVHINPYGLAHVFDFQDANIRKSGQ